MLELLEELTGLEEMILELLDEVLISQEPQVPVTTFQHSSIMDELVGMLVLLEELIDDASLVELSLEINGLDAKLLCNELLDDTEIKQACNNRLLDSMATVLMSERDIR